MKVTPYTVSRTPNFKANITSQNNPEKKKFKIDKWDAQMFGLTCCLTAIEGVRYAKKNFNNLGIRGKIGRVAGASAITVGLAALMMPLWKFLRKINSDN